MSRKTNIILMSNFLFLLIIASSVGTIEGVPTEWNAGDIYKWGYRVYDNIQYINLENDISEIINIEVLEEYTYNITGVDTVAEEYDYIYTDSGTTSSNFGVDYGVDYFLDTIDLDIYCGANFAWNYANNKSVMYQFDFTLLSMSLIEPDWTTLNAGLQDYLNGSEIVDLYADPYTATIYNVTFADVLGNASRYEIMGVRNDLAKAKTKLTAETTSWSAEFDYSGILHERVWNSTASHFDYYPYEEFIYQYELSYTDGGVLSKILRSVEAEITIEEDYTKSISTLEFDLGGIQSVTADFNPLIILPSIFILAVISRIVLKKRK